MERMMEPQSMGFQSGELTAAALGVVFLVVVVVAVIVGLSRLLQHRETLKMLELGGDTETVLRQRELWRNRAGLIHGVKLLVIGVAFIGMTQVSSTWLAMTTPKREVPTEWLTAPPAFLLVGLIFSAVGAVTVVAYAIWSRNQDAASGVAAEAPPTPSLTALGKRIAIVRGVTVMLVGAALLLVAPCFSFLNRAIGSYSSEATTAIGILGMLLIALGLANAIAYGTMRVAPTSGEAVASRNGKEADGEGSDR